MIRLHHSHGTRSMRVLWMLEEIGADYGLEVRPLDATLRLPEYLDLHPAARVPVLEVARGLARVPVQGPARVPVLEPAWVPEPVPRSA